MRERKNRTELKKSVAEAGGTEKEERIKEGRGGEGRVMEQKKWTGKGGTGTRKGIRKKEEMMPNCTFGKF